MKLTYNEFEILVCIEKEKRELSQREISKTTNLSLGTVNKTIAGLLDNKLISMKEKLTLFILYISPNLYNKFIINREL